MANNEQVVESFRQHSHIDIEQEVDMEGLNNLRFDVDSSALKAIDKLQKKAFVKDPGIETTATSADLPEDMETKDLIEKEFAELKRMQANSMKTSTVVGAVFSRLASAIQVKRKATKDGAHVNRLGGQNKRAWDLKNALDLRLTRLSVAEGNLSNILKDNNIDIGDRDALKRVKESGSPSEAFEGMKLVESARNDLMNTVANPANFNFIRDLETEKYIGKATKEKLTESLERVEDKLSDSTSPSSVVEKLNEGIEEITEKLREALDSVISALSPSNYRAPNR